MGDEQDIVFISYAREDKAWAERLYMDLRKNEVNAWLDMRCLKAGANWKHEIPRVIRRARYFLLLISKHSVSKRGYVQKEIKEGLAVLEEFPTGEVYMIPTRLDDTIPIDHELNALNWVELLPNYHDGFSRILSILADLKKVPLHVISAASAPTLPRTFLDKGKEITTASPIMLGGRASINYAPFRSKTEFLHQFFDRLPKEDLFADTRQSYYLTLSTQHPGMTLGDDLLKQYPEEITLVFQNVFRELTLWEKGFSVVLSFGGKERLVAFPFEALRHIAVPELGLIIMLEEPDLHGKISGWMPE